MRNNLIKRGLGILLSLGLGVGAVSVPDAGVVVVAEGAGAATDGEESVHGGSGAVSDGSDASGETVYQSAEGYSYTLYSEEDGGGQKAEITGYGGEQWELVIPRELHPVGIDEPAGNEGESGVPVGRIGQEAFCGNEQVTSVTVPQGTEVRIRKRAFQGCSKLRKVSLSSSVSFYPEVNSYEGEIFQGCTVLEELSLADDMTVLPPQVFRGCTSLKKVRIPSRLHHFGDQAFGECTGLDRLEIPEGVGEMGRFAFKGCSSLTEVTIPSTIKKWVIKENSQGHMQNQYDNGAFQNCTSLQSVVFTPGLTSAGMCSFMGCSALKSVTVPASVEDVQYAFYHCDGLEEIVLQEGVKIIGTWAFKGCSSLEKVTIPSTVTEIGDAAFAQCASLRTLTFPPACTIFKGKSEAIATDLDTVYLLAEDITLEHDYYSFVRASKIYCVGGSGTYGTYCSIAEKQHWPEGTICTFTLDMAGVEVTGYRGVYDGKSHHLAAVSGVREGDAISFYLEGGEASGSVPQASEPDTYHVIVTVTRDRVRYVGEAESVIGKRETVLKLPDMTVWEGEDWVMSPEEYLGDGEVVYTWYRDEALKRKISGKPSAVGVYYVKASVEETVHDTAAQSNVAKVVIQAGTGNPGKDPGTEPGTTDPGKDPGTEPGTTEPGKDPGTEPGTTEPGKDPGTEPGTTDPGKDPGTEPGTTDPGKDPGTEPGTTDPGKLGNGNPADEKKVCVKKVSLKKVKSPAKRTLEIRWGRVSKATGYEIWIGLNKKFTKGKKVCRIKSAKTVMKKIKKLKRKKRYYVKIRAYRVVNGRKYQGAFSGIKSVKVK